MSAQNFAPPLRLEISTTPEAGSLVEPFWFVFDLAQTPEQAEKKLKRFTVPDGCQVRWTENATVTPPDFSSPQDTPETLRALETLGSDNMKLRRENAALTLQLDTLRQAATPAVDAVAGPTPLPFGVGAKLKDVHSGAIVTVTAINAPHPITGETRAGFDYSADGGVSGFVPVGSVGCYVPA